MQHTTDELGEYKFTKELEVEEGQEYQYKFRVGEGDWWLLNEDEPTSMYSPALIYNVDRGPSNSMSRSNTQPILNLVNAQEFESLALSERFQHIANALRM